MVNANNNAPVVNNNAPVANNNAPGVNNPVVNAPVANNNAPVKKQQKGKAKTNKLNMLIGSISRLNTQFVGLQIVSATMVALVFSMLQMSIGIAIVLWPQAILFAATLPDQWHLAGMIALEGGTIILAMVVALLIEGVTLEGLRNIHAALKAIRGLEDEYEEKLAKGDIKDTKEDKEAAKKDLKRRTKRHKNKKWTWIGVSFSSSLMSIALGSLLWDKIFASNGNGLQGIAHYISMAAPYVIAVIIPMTFSSSKLNKESQEEAVKESIQNITILQTALQNEAASFQVDVVTNSILEMRNDPEKYRQLMTTVQETMLTAISNDITHLIALPSPKTVNALPSPKEQTAIDADYKSEPLTPATPASTPVVTPVFMASMPRIAPPRPRQVTQAFSLTHITAPDPEDQDSSSEIELEQGLEQSLFNFLLDPVQTKLVDELFEMQNNNTPDDVVIAHLIRNGCRNYIEQLAPERVKRVWRKVLHEANTEPLTKSVSGDVPEYPSLDDQDDSQDNYKGHYPFDIRKPNPDAINADKDLGEVVGVNNLEDALKLVAKFMQAPATNNNSAQIEQSTPAQNSAQIEQSTPAQNTPKTAQRRKRQLTGEQGKPRSVMTPAKMRKLEQILSTNPTISDRALGAELKVSASTAKKHRETLQTEQS